MKKLSEFIIGEDARDAGYPHELYTPRPLSPKDYAFVDKNENRSVGDVVLNWKGEPIVGSAILKNDKESFQYSHNEKDASEVHIESVDMYRNLWNSIHIPNTSAKYVK